MLSIRPSAAPSTAIVLNNMSSRSFTPKEEAEGPYDVYGRWGAFGVATAALVYLSTAFPGACCRKVPLARF